MKSKKSKQKKLVKKKNPAKNKIVGKKLAKMPLENIFGQKIELPKSEAENSKKPVELEKPIEILEIIKTPKSVGNKEELSARQKDILIYAAIGSIMCVIVFFWFIGVKKSFGSGFYSQDKGDEVAGLSDLFGEAKDTVAGFGEYLDKQKNTISDFTNKAQGIIIQQQIKQDAAKKLKEQLQNSNLNINQ